MSYIENTLGADEKIEVVAKMHWVAYLQLGIIGFFAFILLILGLIINMSLLIIGFILALISLYYFIVLKMVEMVATNKRIIHKTGIISIKTEELRNKKVEAIEIKQSLLGRIFGYANICFSGTGTSKVKFHCIENPHQIKNQIDEIIDKD